MFALRKATDTFLGISFAWNGIGLGCTSYVIKEECRYIKLYKYIVDENTII